METRFISKLISILSIIFLVEFAISYTGLFWLKIALLTIATVAFLTKSYFYNSSRNKHTITWIVGLLLIGPFMATTDFIVLFASLVGFSLAIYTFVLSDYKKHISREASVKYFYLSAISVSLILFAAALNYLVFETTSFDATAASIKALVHSEHFPTELMFVMLAFFTFGFFFKLAAYPGHLWAADVYEGSPGPAFGFFVVPSKIVTLTVFTMILITVYGPLHSVWEPFLLVASIGSLVWGMLASVYERKIKRFVAYTSINQIGFLLMGVTTNTPSEDTAKYTFMYLAVYTIMSFALLAVFLRTKPTPMYLTDFNSFHKFNPFLGMVLVFTMFAMAGIPPLVGFWGKYYLLLAAFQVNYISLLKIALIVSLISTFYYIRVVKIMLFENLRLPKVFTSQVPMILVAVLLISMVGFVGVLDSFLMNTDFIVLT